LLLWGEFHIVAPSLVAIIQDVSGSE